MATKVYTAPNATIYIDGKKAGYITNISFTETINRASVKGLGSLADQEVPAVGWSGSWNASQFFVDFSQEGTKAWLNRINNSVESLYDTLTLGEFPFTIQMFAKTEVSRDDEGRIVTESNVTGERKILLKECYTDSQSFRLSNDSVASIDVSGRYLKATIKTA